MRDQCLPIFREARGDVIEAGMPQLAGVGEASHCEREVTSPPRARDALSDKEELEEPGNTNKVIYYCLY